MVINRNKRKYGKVMDRKCFTETYKTDINNDFLLLDRKIKKNIYNINKHFSYILNNKLVNNYQDQIPFTVDNYKLFNQVNIYKHQKKSSVFFIDKNSRGQLKINNNSNTSGNYEFNNNLNYKSVGEIFDEIYDFEYNQNL